MRAFTPFDFALLRRASEGWHPLPGDKQNFQMIQYS